MKKKTNNYIPGFIITIVFLLTEIGFIYLLAKTALLPVSLLIICGIVLSLIAVGIFVILWNHRKKIRAIIGIILAFVFIALQIVGSYYVVTGAAALNKITDPEAEFTEVGIFVKKDDPAQIISDTKSYTFGILEMQDRNITNAALEKLESELGANVKIKEYAGIFELLDGILSSKEIEVIILNKSFLDLLDESEEHKSDVDDLREIYSLQIESDGVNTDQEEKADDIFTVYISGIDCYGSISRRSRSDVNIIATVNVNTGQILLVSTPRDYYVPLSISNGIPDKLTHAGIYGIQVSSDTLEMLYDTEIDYYFRVNFDGFKEIIDALGGVEVQSEYAFSTYGYSFSKGTNYLNGEAALAFARERYSLPGGDRQRGRNQMSVISGVINKSVSSALLKNYKAVLDGMTGSFETSVPYDTISKLVKKQLSDDIKWNVTTYSADGTGASIKPYSMSANAYVMIPDESTVEYAKQLMQQVKNGEIPQP